MSPVLLYLFTHGNASIVIIVVVFFIGISMSWWPVFVSLSCLVLPPGPLHPTYHHIAASFSNNSQLLFTFSIPLSKFQWQTFGATLISNNWFGKASNKIWIPDKIHNSFEFKYQFKLIYIREGFKKKMWKSMVFCQTRGGVSGGGEKTKLLFWNRVFFREYLESF